MSTTHRPLTPADCELLEFARLRWSPQSIGRKDTAILERFGDMPARHAQRLDALLDHPAALAYDAQTVNRLRSLRDARRAGRSSKQVSA